MDKLRVLKMKLFQETACFKKPFAFKVAETYPLPPYSTVKGFLHYIIGATEFIPMSIAIQGNYESLIFNYQTMRFYKKKDVTTMPLFTHLLYNVELIIHVFAANDILYKICSSIENSNEYFSLGRKEDLARLDSIDFTEVQLVDTEQLDDGIYLKNNVYIPYGYIDFENINGINYRLNYKYEVKNGIMTWEKASVKYVEKGEFIENGIIPVDTEEDVAFFYPLIGVDKK